MPMRPSAPSVPLGGFIIASVTDPGCLAGPGGHVEGGPHRRGGLADVAEPADQFPIAGRRSSSATAYCFDAFEIQASVALTWSSDAPAEFFNCWARLA